MDKCILVKNGLADNWCEKHQRFHTGRDAKYAIGDDEESIAMRKRWDSAKQRVATNTAHWIRLPSVSLTCIHLDPHKLTNDEAKGKEETAKKLETSCRSCTGETSLQRCHGGGGHDGYTTLSWCTNRCVDLFQARPKVEA